MNRADEKTHDKHRRRLQRKINSDLRKWQTTRKKSGWNRFSVSSIFFLLVVFAQDCFGSFVWSLAIHIHNDNQLYEIIKGFVATIRVCSGPRAAYKTTHDFNHHTNRACKENIRNVWPEIPDKRTRKTSIVSTPICAVLCVYMYTMQTLGRVVSAYARARESRDWCKR